VDTEHSVRTGRVGGAPTAPGLGGRHWAKVGLDSQIRWSATPRTQREPLQPPEMLTHPQRMEVMGRYSNPPHTPVDLQKLLTTVPRGSVSQTMDPPRRQHQRRLRPEELESLTADYAGVLRSSNSPSARGSPAKRSSSTCADRLSRDAIPGSAPTLWLRRPPCTWQVTRWPWWEAFLESIPGPSAGRHSSGPASRSGTHKGGPDRPSHRQGDLGGLRMVAGSRQGVLLRHLQCRLGRADWPTQDASF